MGRMIYQMPHLLIARYGWIQLEAVGEESFEVIVQREINAIKEYCQGIDSGHSAMDKSSIWSLGFYRAATNDAYWRCIFITSMVANNLKLDADLAECLNSCSSN
ncbi:hypothetical protein Tsubulata_015956 [Turnera subulata]|uniref:Uncharacterized protein n=1 Tax=Turnera subulata TaxID=218843 RepID=A0A9Q0FXK0_9ROSI|nr:hypothetical protein Tsubulata_015956 [Turnera subulata]